MNMISGAYRIGSSRSLFGFHKRSAKKAKSRVAIPKKFKKRPALTDAQLLVRLQEQLAVTEARIKRETPIVPRSKIYNRLVLYAEKLRAQISSLGGSPGRVAVAVLEKPAAALPPMSMPVPAPSERIRPDDVTYCSRDGQAAFRDMILTAYGRCAVTGCKIESVLERFVATFIVEEALPFPILEAGQEIAAEPVQQVVRLSSETDIDRDPIHPGLLSTLRRNGVHVVANMNHVWSVMVEDRRMQEHVRMRRELLSALPPSVFTDELQSHLLDRESYIRAYHGHFPDASFRTGYDEGPVREMTATEVRARRSSYNEAVRNDAADALAAGLVSQQLREIQEWVQRQQLDPDITLRRLSGDDLIELISPFAAVGTPEARAKGRKLLIENLTPQQRDEYEGTKAFCVTGGTTGTLYRIKEGRQMNIEVLNKRGRRTHGICFLPIGSLVNGDTMLAQKIALELYETEALAIANKFS